MPRHDPAYLADSLQWQYAVAKFASSYCRLLLWSKSKTYYFVAEFIMKYAKPSLPMLWLTAHCTCHHQVNVPLGHAQTCLCCTGVVSAEGVCPSNLALIWIWLTNPSRWPCVLFNPLVCIFCLLYTLDVSRCSIISTFLKRTVTSHILRCGRNGRCHCRVG